jgi:DNA polymerase-3 subunit gamma/tau
MSYLVLARKCRPQLFAEVIGQEHVTRTLGNALTSGRVAHAFLFSGPRGCGKTTTARILSKALNCEHGPAVEPCNKCESCKEIKEGSSMDVQEIDGASNTGVDSIRDLRESTAYMPGKSKFKIYIIDEVHMLSKGAFNALLKTLEEPPPHVKFIFATTEPNKVPLTILSRCQRYDFKRVSRTELQAHMAKILEAEKIPFTPGALTVIAGQAGGSVRDSLSLLEQVIAYAGGEINEERTFAALGIIDRHLVASLLRAIVDRDRASCTELMDKAYTYGYDMKMLAEEILIGMRNLLVLKTGGEKGLEEILTQDEIADLRPMASLMSAPAMHRAFDVMVLAVEQTARSQYPRIVLEMALMKLMVLEPLRPLDELLTKVAELESRLSGGGRPLHAAPAPIPVSNSQPSAPRPPSPAQVPQAQAQAPAPRPAQAAPASAPSTQAESAVHAKKEELNQAPEWLEVMLAVKKAFPPMAARIEHGRFISLEAGRLEVAFDIGSSHLEYIREAGNKKRFEQILTKHFGRPVSVGIEEAAPGGRLTRSAAEERSRKESENIQRAKDEAIAHPVIQEAMKTFGGKVLQTGVEGKKK